MKVVIFIVSIALGSCSTGLIHKYTEFNNIRAKLTLNKVSLCYNVRKDTTKLCSGGSYGR